MYDDIEVSFKYKEFTLNNKLSVNFKCGNILRLGRLDEKGDIVIGFEFSDKPSLRKNKKCDDYSVSISINGQSEEFTLNESVVSFKFPKYYVNVYFCGEIV